MINKLCVCTYVLYCHYPTQVLEEYWKDWERCKANTVKFRFSDKKVQGMLSSHCGDGWEASMIKAKTVRRLNWCSQIVMGPGAI